MARTRGTTSGPPRESSLCSAGELYSLVRALAPAHLAGATIDTTASILASIGLIFSKTYRASAKEYLQ